MNSRNLLISFFRNPVPSWIGFALYNFILFYLSLLPGDELPDVFDLNDKLLHGAGYFVLTAAGAHAFFLSGSPLLTAKPYLWAGWWAMNVSAITEIMQHFVPGRFTDPLDLLANTAGIAAAAGILLVLRPDRKFPLQSGNGEKGT